MYKKVAGEKLILSYTINHDYLGCIYVHQFIKIATFYDTLCDKIEKQLSFKVFNIVDLALREVSRTILLQCRVNFLKVKSAIS
jgi:hypothetical protein